MISQLLAPSFIWFLSSHAVFAAPTTSITNVDLSETVPIGASVPLEAFVSFSIEFSSFIDYAGNISNPNTLSNNLLDSIAKYSGTKPYIRVGGNTQDYAIFNKSQDVALIGIIQPNISTDYPHVLTIGPEFYESFQTWPNTKYTYGFNLAKNGTANRDSLLSSVPYACKALENGKLLHWELGNEPDLYKTSSQGIVRPATWNEQDYVDEWLNGTRAIRSTMAKTCPGLTTNAKYNYYAPSFAGTDNSLNPIVTWEDGLDTDKDIAVITSHNYIGGATQPGVTLQGTLMNHTSNVVSVAAQLNESQLLAGLSRSLNPGLPFILGETNSLYNEGAPGLSNSFGAALWGIDFNLYCAANNIQRTHFHQGTNYRYQAWQPLTTNDTVKGTKPPYYGSLTTAAFLGNLVDPSTRPKIANIPLSNEREAAYAAYTDSKLSRVIIINLQEYNSSNNYTDTYPRPVYEYEIQAPGCCKGKAHLQRLTADGSDALSGITFDGYSYNYELDNGKAVLLHNVTRGETVEVGANGKARVKLQASSAVIVRFDAGDGCH